MSFVFYIALVFADDARELTTSAVIDATVALEAKIITHGGTVVHAQLLNKNKIIGKKIFAVLSNCKNHLTFSFNHANSTEAHCWNIFGSQIAPSERRWTSR